MAITWSDVVTVGAELSSVPTGTQNYFLAQVDKQIDDDQWGDLGDDGRRYLAAHLGAVYNMSPGAAGPVIAEALGPMNVQYASPQKWEEDFLATTKYGRYFLSMARLLPGNLGFVP